MGTLEGMEMEYNGEWHLNKSVPIALIFAIFIQTAGAIWWASTINAKVDELDRSISQSNVIQVDDSRDLASENLRQWARINVLEDAVQRITANNNTLEAILIGCLAYDSAKSFGKYLPKIPLSPLAE